MVIDDVDLCLYALQFDLGAPPRYGTYHWFHGARFTNDSGLVLILTRTYLTVVWQECVHYFK